MKKNKKGFTLIELLAVLVVLAILALITTPIVLSIIKNAKEGAAERSAESYVRALENAVANCMTKYPNIDITTDGNLKLDVENNKVKYNSEECSNVDYKGNKKVTANGSLTITEKNKKIEIGEGITTFTIGTYSFGISEGKAVVQTSEISKTYELGEVVPYKGIDFRVIKDNGSSVTLLKDEPLTSQQTRNYGSTSAYEASGYGGSYFKQDGSSSDYNQSDIKNVVENWAKAELDLENSKELVADTYGYKVRLIKYEEIYNILFPLENEPLEIMPEWLYNRDCGYWTMSSYNNSLSDVSSVYNHGNLSHDKVYSNHLVIRPVITVLKSAVK